MPKEIAYHYDLVEHKRLRTPKRMVQWRLFFHLEKLVQVRRELLSTGKLPLFFQIKVGNTNVYKLQLSDNKGNLELHREAIQTYI